MLPEALSGAISAESGTVQDLLVLLLSSLLQFDVVKGRLRKQ